MKTFLRKRLPKILRTIVGVYLALFIISRFLLSCFSFRLSPGEVKSLFKNSTYKLDEFDEVVAGRSIHYAAIGNDSLPVVLFVHGSPGSWSAFVDFMRDSALLQKVKMVSVDRPGFGGSNFGEGERSLEAQAAALKPIVAKYAANGRKMILVGHSLGGPLIARMAIDYPELVTNLIIVAGSIAPQLEPNEKWFRLPMEFTPIRILIPLSFRASNREILYLKPELEKMMPLWKNIHQGVTVIQGGKDMLVSPKNADFAEAMLINARVKIVRVETMNHFVPWSHPQLIRQAIEEALATP
jgi:pimeloyl-ACP methyl ester carboxylesterase